MVCEKKYLNVYAEFFFKSRKKCNELDSLIKYKYKLLERIFQSAICKYNLPNTIQFLLSMQTFLSVLLCVTVCIYSAI